VKVHWRSLGTGNAEGGEILKRRVQVFVLVVLGVEHAVVVVVVVVIVVVEASASLVAPCGTCAHGPYLSLSLGLRRRACSTARTHNGRG